MRDFVETRNPLIDRVDNAMERLRFMRGYKLSVTSTPSASLTWPTIKKGKLVLQTAVRSFHRNNRTTFDVGERVFEHEQTLFQKIAMIGIRKHNRDAIAVFDSAAKGLPARKEIAILRFDNTYNAYVASCAMEQGYA